MTTSAPTSAGLSSTRPTRSRENAGLSVLALMAALALTGSVSCRRPGEQPSDVGSQAVLGRLPSEWTAAMDSLIGRTSELEQRLATTQPQDLLEAQSRGDGNAIVRLDELLDDALSASVLPPRETDRTPLASFTFLSGGPLPRFEPGRPEDVRNVRAERGVLVIDRPDPIDVRPLLIPLPAPVSVTEVQEIRLRIAVSGFETVLLGWRGDDSSTEHQMMVTVTPDGRFRTYRILGAGLFGQFDGESMRSLVLQFPAGQDGGSRVEIGEILVLSESSVYRERPTGTAFPTVAGETRRALFTRSPCDVPFELDLPTNGRLVFDVGLATAGASRTAPRVAATLENEGRVLTLLRTSSVRHDRWMDLRVEIPASSRGRCRLVLSASGSDAVVLWSNPVVYRPNRQPRRVFLIIQDALRADHMSLYGSARDTTPFTSQLAQHGAVFHRWIAQALQTRMSMASLMTSMYPTANGVQSFYDTLHDNYVSLAEVLRHHGFLTVAVVQNPHAGRLAGLHQGFSIMRDRVPGTSADAVDGTILPLLARLDPGRDLFLFIHFSDPHGPYDPAPEHRHWLDTADDPGPVLERDAMSDPEWLSRPTASARIALYDGEIAANDAAIENLLTTGERQGLTPTVLVMTSDHGEYLGEDDTWGHVSPGHLTVTRVPMIIVSPGLVPANIAVDSPAQHLDLMPTLLDLASVPTRGLPLQGDSLRHLLVTGPTGGWRNRVIVSEEFRLFPRFSQRSTIPFGSFFLDDLHLLRSPPTRHLAYDLRSDPAELRPMSLSSALEQEIETRWSELSALNHDIRRHVSSPSELEVEVDPESVEVLRALGYLDTK